MTDSNAPETAADGSAASAGSTAIPWDDVAIVGFNSRGRAVIISSVKPHVVCDTVLSLVEDGGDEEPETVRTDLLIDAANSLEWKLYPTEEAKRVFCFGK